MTNVFDSNCHKKIGVDFETKEIDLDGREVKLIAFPIPLLAPVIKSVLFFNDVI